MSGRFPIQTPEEFQPEVDDDEMPPTDQPRDAEAAFTWVESDIVFLTEEEVAEIERRAG